MESLTDVRTGELTEMDTPAHVAGTSRILRRGEGGLLGPVARNGVLSMAALLVLGGTRIVYGSMVSRVTDRETFGMIGVLTALTLISSFILPAGVAAAMSRFVPYNRGRGDLARARGLQRALSRVGTGAGVLLSIAAATGVLLVLRRPLDQSVEVGLLTLAYSLYTIDKATLFGFGRVGQYLRMEIVGCGVTLASTVAVIATGSTWYLMPFVIGYGVFVFGARLALRADERGDVTVPTPADRWEVVGYVALACVGTLGSAGFLQATQLLAGSFAAKAELAYFTAAITLMGPMYFLPRALGLALFPFMSEAHGAGDSEAVRRHADLATRALLASLAPVFVVAELLSAEVLVVFGGAKYAGGAAVLEIILAATYLAVVQVASVNALSSGSGWQLRTPVGWSVAGCLVGLVIVAFVGGPLGAVGVGLAYLIGTAITASGPIAVVWRRYRMPWAGPITRALLTVATALVIARLLDTTSLSGWERWVAHGGAAGFGFAIALAVLRGDLASIWPSTRRRRAAEGAQDVSLVAIEGLEAPSVAFTGQSRTGGEKP